MKFATSLRTRLVFTHLLVSLVSVVLISAFAGGSIFRSAQVDLEQNLKDLSFATSNALEQPLQAIHEGQDVDLDRVQAVLNRLLANHPNVLYTLYLPDASAILDRRGTLPAPATQENAPEVLAALAGPVSDVETTRRVVDGENSLYVAVSVQVEDELLGVLRLGTPLRPALDSAWRSLMLLVAVALMVSVAAMVFALLLTNTIVRPIEDLTSAADCLAQGDLNARVSPAGPSEIHGLAQAFNLMANRLQGQMEELRNFVANASHELRTPLTVVKLRAEALQDGALEEPHVAKQFISEIENEVDRLTRMVNDMLDLSRLEAGLIRSQRAPLNLGLMATDVYETFNIRAARAKVNLNLSVEPDLPNIRGNEDQLRRVLYNFIDNAIKFTPTNGSIDVVVQRGERDRTVCLMVQDTGMGIPPEHLPHIFERFYRAEATRPRYYELSKGSGLGLAIAKSIIESHGGRIGVASQPGQGSTFWAELPALPAGK